MEITHAIIETMIACEIAASLPALCANPEWRKTGKFKILDVERLKQALAKAATDDRAH